MRIRLESTKLAEGFELLSQDGDSLVKKDMKLIGRNYLYSISTLSETEAAMINEKIFTHTDF